MGSKESEQWIKVQNIDEGRKRLFIIELLLGPQAALRRPFQKVNTHESQAPGTTSRTMVYTSLILSFYFKHMYLSYTILTILSAQLRRIKYIHIVEQSSPPSCPEFF